MNELQERILNEGYILPGDILKVDSFLNHQMDMELIDHVGQEFYKKFENEGITKILTIEASGIAIACMTAYHFHVPAIFAKKSRSANIGDSVYQSTVHSYTYDTDYPITLSSKYLSSEDTVVIVDDFMANGKAVAGLIDLCNQAGARVAGVGICIEKGFQSGGQEIREKGIRVESLAIIDSMENDVIKFR